MSPGIPEKAGSVSRRCRLFFGRFCAAAAGLLLLAGVLPAQAAMGPQDARLLLERSGFSPTPEDIRAWSGYSREDAVERLLQEARQVRPPPLPPAETLDYLPPRSLRDLSGEARKAAQQRQARAAVALKAWWLEEMLATPSPLRERMTLFWHNHFVSSQQKVKSVALMAAQNQLLRQHALGNFADLLHAVAKDPAMLVYLDSASSRKEQPNENFAREVMELFTLGEGHYGEHDIQEAARAFTGWSIEPASGAFRWRPFIHDRGVKTVLGESGNFDGDQVLDILLRQPATAEFIVTKLWREFISPQPDAAEVKRIAAAFRQSGYDIPTALRRLFLSPAFWSPENRASLVKSPVELVVGSLRQFRVTVPDATPLALLLARQMGQNLLAPPNVKGWPGGEAWISSSLLLARQQYLDKLLRQGGRLLVRAALPEEGDEAGLRRHFQQALNTLRVDGDDWAVRCSAQGLEPAAALLPRGPVLVPPAGAHGSALVGALLRDPVYQLK